VFSLPKDSKILFYPQPRRDCTTSLALLRLRVKLNNDSDGTILNKKSQGVNLDLTEKSFLIRALVAIF
ncbi:MAG: hypothetical protein LBU92_05890, partial [Prevotellaceae bacterium]|nr:hypothetical protein [Prevotellaceae bacterium]